VAAVIEQPTKRWNYEEYYKLGDDQRYEVIDARLLMAPAPDTWHQDWLSKLNTLITLFLWKNNLGRLFIAPVDVVLDPENVVQPDLVFVAANNLGIIQRRAIFGTPDLVVEMISPSSVQRDRYTKMDLYARFGVKEYWIGDAANRSLEILTLSEGNYKIHCSAAEKGELTSIVLTGLKFDLAELQQ
jgi:Uma2 family endonuclease